MSESRKHVPILDVNNVTVDYDGFLALQDLSFSMDYPELRVVIGPNGAGKSTFMDVITGKVKPAAGTVRFQTNGQSTDLTKLRKHEIATLGIGRKFQRPSVFSNLTVWENLDISLRRKSKGLFSTLFSKSTSSEAEQVSSVLETIGLVDRASGMAGALSHGQKQWLEIGMVLVQDPKLLLIDEPVAGMTDQETENTGVLLESLTNDHSVIVIEHDMEFVRQIARTVSVLYEGSLLIEGLMESVQADPKVMGIISAVRWKPMLQLDNINVYYGQSHILRDVSCQIDEGQVLCLMGRNGVGKTTVLKTVMGILQPQTGRVSFGEKDISRAPPERRVGRGIAYVPQGREIFPYLTVWENLHLGFESSGSPWSAEAERSAFEEVFELFPKLAKVLDRAGGVLSGGEQQQLAIGRALLGKPKLLLLDEPTEGIQPSIVMEIMRVIESFKAQRRFAILLVEQYMEFAATLADTYVIMSKGAVVGAGHTSELTEEQVKQHLIV